MELSKTGKKIEELQKNKTEDAQVIQELEFLKKYLHSLKVIHQTPNHSCISFHSSAQVTPQTKLPALENNFLKALKKIDSIYKSDINPSEVYRLIDYIESNQEQWRAGTEVPAPFIIRNKQGKTTPVVFELDEKGRIYLEFEPVPLGNGATKIAHQITSYGSWSKLARLTLKPKRSDRAPQFINEQKILKKIMDIPAKELTGIVETYHVGEDQIIQTMYAQDLFNAMVETNEFQKITNLQRLDLIHQLSVGLRKLHELGIHHGDLKEENILVNLAAKKPKLAISDFDTSDYPEESIRNKEPRIFKGGTTRMHAPEFLKMLVDSGQDNLYWNGLNETEKKENVFKTDVYAAATIAYQMMKPDQESWVTKCENLIDDERHLYSDFLKCQSAALNHFIKEEAESPALDPFEHLIAAAVNTDPSKRINSKQFEEGMNYICEKSLRGKGHSAPISKKITFIDPGGAIRSKILKLNSNNPLELESEIQFLKTIGTLTSIVPTAK